MEEYTVLLIHSFIFFSMCTAMRIFTHFLSSPSPVPPEIVDELSSGSSVVVQENGNVTLTCHAEGNPKPRISWVREDQRAITINKRSKGGCMLL